MRGERIKVRFICLFILFPSFSPFFNPSLRLIFLLWISLLQPVADQTRSTKRFSCELCSPPWVTNWSSGEAYLSIFAWRHKTHKSSVRAVWAIHRRPLIPSLYLKSTAAVSSFSRHSMVDNSRQPLLLQHLFTEALPLQPPPETPTAIRNQHLSSLLHNPSKLFTNN
jgi:hypothetical protein